MKFIGRVTKYTGLILLFVLIYTEIHAQSKANFNSLDSLNFLVISDFGGQGGKIQREVGEELGSRASIEQSRFVITCGDNFHQNGITTITDSRWKTDFEDIYI